MQKIASENNLSETAFFVPEGDGFRLRWFTPKAEVSLCGHATLASAHVLFTCLGYEGVEVRFETRGGLLRVRRDGKAYAMDFPPMPLSECDMVSQIEAAFGMRPERTLASTDCIAVFENEAQIREAAPDTAALKRLDLRGICICAPGENSDFVLRFFAPKYGVDEDPVTGSAMVQAAGYWAKRLGKRHLKAKQLSSRGAKVTCQVYDDRVTLGGQAVKYLEGTIDV